MRPNPLIAARDRDDSAIRRVAAHALSPLARLLHAGDMRALGLRRTNALARAFNGLRYRRLLERRRALYRERFDELAAGNGAPDGPVPVMRDGFALDSSRSLPHLGALLSDAREIIAERGGTFVEDTGKPFLQSLLQPQDLARYPSLLDFATSSSLVATVARHCGFIPHLSGGMPRGVRLMESSTKFDPGAGGPLRYSQLWHTDYHSLPTIYVFVALENVTPEKGPLHFLGARASQRAAAALRYRERGAPYRVTDEAFYAAVPQAQVERFCEPAGSVLFLDSSACFHFGSRACDVPRYHMQYAYVAPVRTDFTDVLSGQYAHRARAQDAPLRRLVLDREHIV